MTADISCLSSCFLKRRYFSKGLVTLSIFTGLTDFAKAQNNFRSDTILHKEIYHPQQYYVCSPNVAYCNAWNAEKYIPQKPLDNVHFPIGKMFTLSFPKERPTLSLNDQPLSFAFGMLLQFDLGGSLGPDDPERSTRMSGIMNFLRRARFITITRYKKFELTASADPGYAGRSTESLFQLDVAYTGFRNTRVELGLTQPRVGMDDAEANGGSQFLERPAIIDMIRGIAGAQTRLGFGATHWEKRSYVQAFVTGPQFGDRKNFQKNQIGAVLRVAGRPWFTKDNDLHLGLSSSMAFHGNNRIYSLSSLPEMTLWQQRHYLKTGAIKNVNNIVQAGPEIGFRWKRWVLKSEYSLIHLNRGHSDSEPQRDLNFRGYYIAINRTLFGQPRLYDIKRAVFDQPFAALFNPATGDWGALECSGRWSVIDLNNHPVENGGIRGGKQTVWSAGINWYPSSHMRLMLEFNHIIVSRSNKNSHNLYGGTNNLIGSRLQVNF